jgi:hypothetical protein
MRGKFATLRDAGGELAWTLQVLAECETAHIHESEIASSSHARCPSLLATVTLLVAFPAVVPSPHG